MKKINQNKVGFSMVELMVAITIVSIMTAVTLVSLSEAREKKEVETAAREVVAAVREAQNYALTGKNSGAGCSRYIYFWNGTSGLIYGTGLGCKVLTLPLKNGVRFENQGRYGFRVPFSAVEFLSGSADVILKKGSTCFQVIVLASGLAEEAQIDCP